MLLANLKKFLEKQKSCRNFRKPSKSKYNLITISRLASAYRIHILRQIQADQFAFRGLGRGIPRAHFTTVLLYLSFDIQPGTTFLDFISGWTPLLSSTIFALLETCHWADIGANSPTFHPLSDICPTLTFDRHLSEICRKFEKPK